MYFLNEEFRKILNFNYLSFYKKFFLCKNKEFLIKKFGLNANKSKNLFIYIENQKKLFNNNEEEIKYLNLLEYSATNKFIEFIKDENFNEKNLFLNKNDDETKENSDKKSNFSEDEFDSNEGKILFNVIK